MTELSPTIVSMGPAEHRPGPQRERLLRAAGRPVTIAEVRIVDGEGRELPPGEARQAARSDEHTSELQSQSNLVSRFLLEKKKPPPPAGKEEEENAEIQEQ